VPDFAEGGSDVSHPRISAVLRRCARFLGRGEAASTDAALLERLARDRDDAAFGELLARHGPAVWAVCRRQVRSEADAEDVFQATFLVLARDAARVRKAASVGSWLHGVAVRIGRKVRVRQDRVPDPARLRVPVTPPEPAADLTWGEVRAALDEELAGLPESLRAPLLLCYFEGLTQDEAAAELGWNKRTVKSRIDRGRKLLRGRLTRRGIELPAVLAVPLLAPAAPAVPPAVVAGLPSAALAFAGRASPTGVTAVATELARTEVPVTHSLRAATLALSAAGLLVAASLSLAGRPGGSGDETTTGPDQAVAQAPAAPADSQPTPGAVRLGNTRFRLVGWHSRAFLTDGGKTLIVVGDGPLLRFWDVENGKQLHEMKLTGIYNDAAFAPDTGLLAVVGVHWPKGQDNPSEGALWLIDTSARKLLRTVGLPAASGSNHAKVCITADGKRVFVEYEGDVRIIDGKTGDELIRHKGRVNAGTMTVSRDGKTVAFGRFDVYLWQWETGEEPKKFARISGGGTELMAFAPDGKSLYVADLSGGRVAQFEVSTGRQMGTFDLGVTPWKWSFSPDGKTLAVVYYDSAKLTGRSQAVVLWDPATGKEAGRFPIGRTKASHASWSADGSRLAATTDYRAWVWDVKTGKPIGPASTGHEGNITAFAFGPDGRLFTGSDDHTIRSWDAAGKPGLELTHDYWVRGVAVSPDGSLVAGSALGNDLRIWDAKTGTERFKLLGNGRLGGTRRVQFTPEGKRLVSWGDDFYLRVWDMRNGKLLVENRTVPDGFTEADLDDDRRMQLELIGSGAAALSGDGKTFAYARYKVVQIFDVETGKEHTRFEGDPNGITSLALSPDGRRLAIAGRGKSIETRLPGGMTRYSTSKEHQVAVWDVSTKKPVWQGTAEGSWSQIAFSHDGSRLGASSDTEDKVYSIRIWDATTGKDLGRVNLPEGGRHFAFDRTGKRLAVSQGQTTAMIFDLETALKPSERK
jgi:RNA polymerase sigma factor (sigma-70 family)